MTLIAETLQDFAPTSRKFRLMSENDEKFFIDELLRRPRPDLMIKIIGENYDFARNSIQAAIDRAFRHVIREIMEETSMFYSEMKFTLINVRITNRYLALECKSRYCRFS